MGKYKFVSEGKLDTVVSGVGENKVKSPAKSKYDAKTGATAELKFYDLKPILAKRAQYNVVIGERSNGKTYGFLLEGIKRYWKTGKQMAYIRRWYDDIKGKRADSIFASMVANKEIEKITGGEYNSVKYYSQRWYFAFFDYETMKYEKVEPEPFCYGFALNGMEHDKSASYPNVTWIVFDEFLSRLGYIPDEFVLFMNVLSTIIRHRNDVIVNMLGNTVNKYCPYFEEMGLKHIKDQKQGSIDIYTYGESALTVAVEYCDNLNKTKPSNVYFAFDNPKLQMITGGVWELDIYPHLPHEYKYKPDDVKFIFTLIFDGEMVQGDVVIWDNVKFTFFHKRTSEIKEDEFTVGMDMCPTSYHLIDYRKASLNWHKIVRDSLSLTNCSFFQNNDIGELVSNYRKFFTKI